MRKTIYKAFWACGFEKEEKWLNEMAAKGLALVAVDWCRYTFEESNPGEYNVRLELLENLPVHAESQQYIKFIEETGAEYIGSLMRWVYFRRQTVKGEFNLYSDYTSRMKHLSRIGTLIGVISISSVCIGISNILIHLGTEVMAVFFLGIINIMIGLLIGFGGFRILLKRRRLQKEHNLFE